MCEENKLLVCEFCGRQFISNQGLGKHKTCCKSNSNRKPSSNNHIISLNASRSKKDGWKCKYCLSLMRTKRDLYDHYANAHTDIFVSKHSCIKYDWRCKHCNTEFKSRRRLYEHYKTCEEKAKLPHDSKGRLINSAVGEYKCDFCSFISTSKSGVACHIKYCINNPNRAIRNSKSHSYETKLKLSIAARKRVGYRANYNAEACKYIDDLNLEMGWHLQHALNGGEITIGPYFLDGYDKELNIAFEYDEPAHHNKRRRDHDLVKQKFIIDTLQCSFYRYDEKTKVLYDVTSNTYPEEILNEVLNKHIRNRTHSVISKKKKAVIHRDRKNVQTEKRSRNVINENLKEIRWRIILNSNIDFSKFGWVEKLASLFGITAQKTGAYIRKHFKDFYSTECFRKNKYIVPEMA